MPSEEYERFKAAVERSQRRSFLAPSTEQQAWRLQAWLQRLLDAGDPDVIEDVERERRRTLGLPGSLADAEDWPDLDDDSIEVPDEDPLFGWRFWRVSDGQLIPGDRRFGSMPWQPGDHASRSVRCRGKGPHPGPDRRCSCGIRVMASRRLAESYATYLGAPEIAIGSVAVWGHLTGRAYAHSGRWYEDPPCTIRASHARIIELHLDDDQLEAELRATYAVTEQAEHEEES